MTPQFPFLPTANRIFVEDKIKGQFGEEIVDQGVVIPATAVKAIQAKVAFLKVRILAAGPESKFKVGQLAVVHASQIDRIKIEDEFFCVVDERNIFCTVNESCAGENGSASG